MTRTIRLLSLLGIAALLAAGKNAPGALVDAVWTASSGNWNGSGNWLPAVVPNNGTGGNTYHVKIDNGGGTNAVVAMNISPTIDLLTISAGDTLNLNNIQDLRVEIGPIVNDGLISINGTNSPTDLMIGSSMSLDGGGVLQLNNTGNSRFYGVTGGPVSHLTQTDTHTIRGGGAVGVNLFTMTNNGLIEASNASSMSLDLAAGSNVNAGTIQAVGNGTLTISGTEFDNSDGVIKALDTSHVRLSGSIVNGGLLEAEPGATISGVGSTFRDITLTGLFQVFNVDDIHCEGTITNDGVFLMSAFNSPSEFRILDNGVTLAGSGVLDGGNDPDVLNYISDNGAATPPLLVNTATHTIRGGIRVGNNRVVLDNQGLIDASVAGAPMTMDLAAGANVNTGTIQASGRGTLFINDSVIDNTTGTIDALDTSHIRITTSTIDGGQMQADPGAGFSANGASFRNITLTGLLTQANVDDALYEGTITNNGNIQLVAFNSPSEFRIHDNGVTLAGSGVLEGGNDPDVLNYISDNGAVTPPLLVNTATHTIRGGIRVGNNRVVLDNQGLIDASVAGAPMTMDLAAGPNVNTGTIQASGAGGLSITGTVLENADGVIKALDTSSVSILDGSTINGGLLEADAGAQFTGRFSRLKDITLTGLLRQFNVDDVTYEGTITNNGTISLQGTNSPTDVIVPAGGTTTFTGPGQIAMGNNAQNRIVGGGAMASLVNAAGHTIRGSGSVGENGLNLTNNGLIEANQSVAMTIDLAAGVNVNTGTIQAIDNGGMNIVGTPLDNTAGSIKSLGTATVGIIDGSSIDGGHLEAEPGAQFYSRFSSLRNITLTGLLRQFNVDDVVYEGTITNNGTIQLEATNSLTEFVVHENGATLAGSGQLVLGNNGNNLIDDSESGPLPLLTNGANHTIRGSGDLGANAVHITNNGTVRANQSVPMVIDPPSDGQGFLNNGTIEVETTLNIVTGNFTNAGTVDIPSGGTLNRTGHYTQTSGTTTVNGTLNPSLIVQNQGGTITGSGSILGTGPVFNAGTIAPGNGIGELVLPRGLIMSPSSIISIEIGGLAPVTGHDVLRMGVDSLTQVDGVLKVRFVNGFDPQIGDSFTVMHYTDPTLPGTQHFGDFDYYDIPCDLRGRRIEIIHTHATDFFAGSVVVRIIAAENLFDLNCDCAYSLETEVQAFILALFDRDAWEAQYPDCDILVNDLNGDTLLDGRDVQGLVDALMN